MYAYITMLHNYSAPPVYGYCHECEDRHRHGQVGDEVVDGAVNGAEDPVPGIVGKKAKLLLFWSVLKSRTFTLLVSASQLSLLLSCSNIYSTSTVCTSLQDSPPPPPSA